LPDMQTIQIHKGLDIPISGNPEQKVRQGKQVKHVALIGDDYVGMKPTMEVNVGDSVKTGQVLFSDKKNKGVQFTSPGCGTVIGLNRGAKRKFESLVIELAGEESIRFFDPSVLAVERSSPAEIRKLLIDSGMWTAFRTRPYGKIPSVDSSPASVFITAIDTSPFAPDPQVIIGRSPKEYQLGLRIVQRLFDGPIHYCTGAVKLLAAEELSTIEQWRFQGPHPAGLPSTHIHFIDPVHEEKTVWHIGYQDIIALGHFFTNGTLYTEKIVSLAGAAVHTPALVTTRVGASLPELCEQESSQESVRILSGSVLSGRESIGNSTFLGRFHNQVSLLKESNGRSFCNWLRPGADRFSMKPLFISALQKHLSLPFNTALWGGKRAIFPLGTYEQVMPLDIIATSLLKSLACGDTEKSKDLGCLELIEEDLALCGFVCPGKNEFGTALRQVLTAIERGD
jgi:Na+-transporting NADH:ubiquinone oxidoreductase subunit A